MNISLAVQVYNGGVYWQQCWESILANIDFFDQIFISISKSPRQDDDVRLVKECSSSQIHLLVHDHHMTAVEHGKKLDLWLSSFGLKGHVFLLCHDDILLQEGLLQLKNLELSQSEAVLGPWTFFSEDNGKLPLTVKQFRQGNGDAISRQKFGFLVDQQFYAINISGVVIPASIFNKRKFPWHLCSYGSRSEYLHLCNPEIKFIHQPPVPAVKIRRHGNSEGALMTELDNQFDTVLYLNLAFEVHGEEETRRFTIQSLGYMLRKSPLRGLQALLVTQLRLLKCKFLTPGTAVRIWYALVCSSAEKIYNRISGKIKRNVE